jgi:hypothetical protein
MKTQITKRMKLNLRFFLIVFLISNFSFGQLWYYQNNDWKHRAVMVELLGYLAVQNAENVKMEKSLNDAVSKLRDELNVNYANTTGPYDQNSSFIQGSALRALNAAMGTMIASAGTYNAYFPQTKRDYLQEISNNSTDLLWLQFMNSREIRNADRQHIYRIRRQILKAYSADERRGRALLMIMALFYAGENIETVANTLKALEIIN